MLLLTVVNLNHLLTPGGIRVITRGGR